ncbi:MAG: alpha/beta fold hydrolase [bacterium]
MHAESNPDVWWPLGPPRPASPARLICLPYAGGGASVFRSLRRAAGERLDVCPVQLPGREARIREAPFRNMASLAETLVDVLRPRLASPYGLFGYSMGALIAFELTGRLAAAGLPPPRTLFVAAATPPHRRKNEAWHRLPDDRFREALRDLNGTPDAVLEHEELMALLLPTLRADFELCETHPSGRREAVDVPIVAFGGTEDPSVPLEDLRAWAELTRAGFRAITFPAHHFFLEARAAELLRHVLAEWDSPAQTDSLARP